MTNAAQSTVPDTSRVFNTEEQERKQFLLQRHRSTVGHAMWAGSRYFVQVAVDRTTLSEIGELLALERRCSPFLSFHLEVDSAERALLTISGPDGAHDFIEATFGPVRFQPLTTLPRE